jgi:lysozyme
MNIDIPLDGDNPYMLPLPPPPPMTISDEGMRLIKSFEGYHRKLPDGGCVAYQTALGGGRYDIPTIGYGCTVGVTMGMTWTLQEAEAALRREIAKHEAYVIQLVTVEINQNEYDALVSFCYNCGPGNLKRLVVPLNRGDRLGTVKALSRYTRAQGRVLPGLVARRTREAALFQKPIAAPLEPAMPQSGITPTMDPPHPATVAVASTAAVSGASYWQQLRDSFSHIFGAAQDPAALMPALPSDPLATTENFLSTGQRVQSIGATAWGFRDWLTMQRPLIGVAFLLVLALIWFRPWGRAE